MANKDSITVNGITLTEGSPSAAGNKRYFGKLDVHSKDVEINGEIYTVYAEVKAYHRGSAVTKVAPKTEAYDSSKRKVKNVAKVPAASTADGGSSSAANPIMDALAKLMTIVDSQGKVLARLTAAEE